MIRSASGIRHRAASSLRGLQQSVHRLVVDSGTASLPAYKGTSGMSTLAAFFYTVLFRTIRVLIAPRAGNKPHMVEAGRRG